MARGGGGGGGGPTKTRAFRIELLSGIMFTEGSNRFCGIKISLGCFFSVSYNLEADCSERIRTPPSLDRTKSISATSTG